MFAFPFVCSQKDTTRNRKRGAMIHTQSTPDTAMWQMLIHVVAMERLQLRVPKQQSKCSLVPGCSRREKHTGLCDLAFEIHRTRNGHTDATRVQTVNTPPAFKVGQAVQSYFPRFSKEPFSGVVQKITPPTAHRGYTYRVHFQDGDVMRLGRNRLESMPRRGITKRARDAFNVASVQGK